ncbi:MAG: tRNA (adenosine(37)-N6)-threonylcarbamoyltransferase complex transferase subunit TsaD [Candidatus Levybacteria bacterium]|nr:tRNA (adenosine(37)-N6)-threonylcarbamoyltransferase complex transferase subunit TsaD [Candidatus Levybacteria bacterium]
MTILGIESSCDETGASVVTQKDNVLTVVSDELASSLNLHAKTGGIIPEAAAREQLRYILPVIKKAVAKVGWNRIDAIAVTYGPGLIGSLLVGVETAKTIAYTLNKPIIPVNHLYGHIYANWLEQDQSSLRANSALQKSAAISYKIAASVASGDTPRNDKIEFPALALVVSGGHTDLVIMQNHETLEVIGGTRDDAAGEAFDKIGRLLGLPYPAGPTIAKLAEKGDPKAFQLPRPMIGSPDFDFSFSGLKTAALREVKNNAALSSVIAIRQLAEKQSYKIAASVASGDTPRNDNKILADFCASVQQAIVDVLVKKTIKAAKFYNVKSILLGGGVAANQLLREKLTFEIGNFPTLSSLTFGGKLEIPLSVPPPNFCTDNGAMIAAAGFFAKPIPWQQITANPELYY